MDSRKLADTIRWKHSTYNVRVIHGVSGELANSILIALELGKGRERRRKIAITCPSDICSAIRHYADYEQENRHGTQ